MIDEKIHVGIRSYNRAGKVDTLDLVPFGYIWIPRSQEEDYLQYYPSDRLIVIEDHEDGNSAKKFNTILDQTPCEWVLILDDDITEIGYWEDGDHFVMDPDEIRELIIQGFILADDLGVKLWGINQLKDPIAYRTYTPFSFLSPVLGPLTGHLGSDLRYDEEIPLKEDYDYFLQNIKEFRKCLRMNKYHYVHDHAGKKKGGITSQRSMDEEIRCASRLIEKWGSKIVTAGGSAGGGRRGKGKNILNTKISVPIKGV